jgi:hypothetical protein
VHLTVFSRLVHVTSSWHIVSLVGCCVVAQV